MSNDQVPDALSAQREQVERWPTEIPLLILVVLAAIAIWVLLAVTIIGFFYVILIGIFLFLSHVVMVAYIRGSAVRLGPNQLPDLYERVRILSARVGIEKEPEAYLMQAGGALNAFATKFMRSDMIVIYSDLLEACGDNQAARDMIIAHELGHLRCGHLRWLWLLAPGLLVPFLGQAYSRAREYTCDRWGLAGCGELKGALHGLTVLAAGGKEAPRVNLEALAEQRNNLNTGWMTLGKWLMGHPPLCERILALAPSLLPNSRPLRAGAARACLILGLVFVLPATAAGVFATLTLPAWVEKIREASEAARGAAPLSDEEIEILAVQVAADFEELSELLQEVRLEKGVWPTGQEELYEEWARLRPGQSEPLDPFDGFRYGYVGDEEAYQIWSSGPDREPDTTDDIMYDSDEF